VSTWLVLWTGFLLGFRHAFDQDHVTAVTHFISLEPDARRSAWFGARWALGHAVTVLTLGSLVLLLHLKFPPAFERAAEVAVGVSLIALAVWRLSQLVRLRGHVHRHAHDAGERHSHPHTHDAGGHVHPWAPTMVGMLHGAAGTVEVFVIIPISMMASPALAYLYIGCFSVGCLLSMSGYGFLAGQFYTRASTAGERLYQGLVVLTSLVGLVLGWLWISRHL